MPPTGSLQTMQPGESTLQNDCFFLLAANYFKQVQSLHVVWRKHMVPEAVLLNYCPECIRCPAYAIQMGQTTWATMK